MKTLIRLMPAIVVGLVAGLLIARVAFPGGRVPATLAADAVTDQVASNSTAAFSSITSRSGAIATSNAWEEFLLSALPAEPKPTVDEVSARLRSLAKQAFVGNPVRAEVERDWLLAQSPVESIPSLFRQSTAWSTLDAISGGVVPLLKRWAERDPQAALSVLKELPPEQATRGVEAIFADWTAKDQARAFDWLEKCTNTFLKAHGNSAAVTALARTDPAAAIARSDTLEPQARSSLFRAAVSSWAEQDGPAVLGWIDSSAPSELRAELFRTAINSWSVREPDRALDHLLGLAADSNVNSVLVGPFQHLALSDPDAAVQKLAGLPAERITQDLVESIGQNAAMSFGLAGGKDMGRAQSLADLLPEGKTRNAFLAGLVKFGAANNVEFALNVLPQLPEGRIRDTTVTFLAGVWAKQDAVRAGEWINTLPPTRSRDMAAAEYANTVLALDPLRAARWIESVGDPEVRSMWIDFFYQRWREMDSGTAQAWLGQTQALNEQQKAKLAKRLGP
jgi:hypothetical protein